MHLPRKLLPLILAALAAFAFGFAYIHARREASARASGNNMRQLGLGLLNYEAAYRCFPPARLESHSWRIRLAPFLVSSALYMNYDFGRDWDSAENMLIDRRPILSGKGPMADQLIIAGMPFDYANGRCVRQSTAFVMLPGDTAFGDANRGRTISESPDGPENTIAIVQTARPDIHWLHPLDLDIATMSYQINAGPNSISAEDGAMPLVCFADATVCWIDSEIPAEAVRSLVTIDGDENWTRKAVRERGWLHPLN